jgi:hypothetical protein
MKYTLIDREHIPPQSTELTMTERRRQSERVVAELVPGKAAKIEPGPKDTPRGIKASLTRAAKRQNRAIQSWEIDGVVYAELVQSDTD